jgi:hypothetical protein
MSPEEKSALIQDLHAKYPILTLSESNTFVIFKPAGRIEYNTYRQQRDGESTRYDADFTLAYACVVYPDRKALDLVFDRMPAFASSLAVDIIHESGGLKSSVKKV